MSSPQLPPPPEGARVIDTGYVRFWRGADGLVYDDTYMSGRVEVEALQLGLDAISELTDGQGAPLVAIAAKMGAASKEARELFGSPEAARLIHGLAMVAPSPIARLVLRFAVRLSPPGFPVRFFESVEKAQAWCHTLSPPPR